jgi:two-component system cell cycle response regulator
VLCDLRLPIQDGYEVLSEIRKEPARGDTIVIAVTAYSMPDDRAKATAAGFDGYISKPIDPASFVQQIEALVRPDLRATRPGSGS